MHVYRHLLTITLTWQNSFVITNIVPVIDRGMFHNYVHDYHYDYDEIQGIGTVCLPDQNTYYQDSPVVSRKAKKKQHACTQPTRLPVCYLQVPML